MENKTEVATRKLKILNHSTEDRIYTIRQMNGMWSIIVKIPSNQYSPVINAPAMDQLTIQVGNDIYVGVVAPATTDVVMVESIAVPLLPRSWTENVMTV